MSEIKQISPTKWEVNEYRSVPKCWAKIIELDQNEDKCEMLYHLARVVEYAKRDSNYEALDELLLLINVKDVSTQLIVSVLRFTFCVRQMLNIWEHQVKEAFRIFDERNLNSKSLLRGLL